MIAYPAISRKLHHKANYDALIRGVLGALPTDCSLGKQYRYQNTYDNVSLIDDELLIKMATFPVVVAKQGVF